MNNTNHNLSFIEISKTYTMPKIQQRLAKNKDVSGNPQKHWKYSITIPHTIAEYLRLDKGQIFHAIRVKSQMTLKTTPSTESTPITIQSRKTRKYRGQQYYTTDILIPIQFIRDLNLKKGDNLDVTTSYNTIIITNMR